MLPTFRTSINPFDCCHKRDFVPGLCLRYTPDFPADCTASTSDGEQRCTMIGQKWNESRKKRSHPKTKTGVCPCFVPYLLMIIIRRCWSPTANLTTRNFQVPKTCIQTPISIAMHLRLFLFPNTSPPFYCPTKLLVNHDPKGVYVWSSSRTQIT